MGKQKPSLMTLNGGTLVQMFVEESLFVWRPEDESVTVGDLGFDENSWISRSAHLDRFQCPGSA